MSDKKHIDRLFQEKLRNFEATPHNSVWKNISAELETKKKKRRIIPLWIKVSGIAASLLLLLTIGNAIFSDVESSSNVNTIVETSPQDKKKQTKQNNDLNTHRATELQNTTKDANSNIMVVNENSSTENSFHKEQNSKKNIITTYTSSTASTSQKENNLKTNNHSKTNTTFEQNINSNRNYLITSNKSDNKKIKNENINFNKELLKENNTISSKNTLAETLNSDKINIDESGLDKIIDSTKTDLNNEEKLSITEELVELEKNKEKNITKEQNTKPENRWYIKPNMAPVYFNSLGEGSSLSAQFNSNKKSGDINFSYGIKAAYALNNKLRIRTGINKLDLGYSTNDVYAYDNLGEQTSTNLIKNIDFTPNNENITLITGGSFALGQLPTVLSNLVEGSIDQKLGFIEVPIELEYKLSQRKMGITIVGGFSALFLNQNEIYATLNGRSRLLGKATNINNTSFSANLGIGVDFKLSEKFNFNLEPTFKYQLNTFSETTGNFNPYFIGLYSGLSFKF